jgi:NADH-quinone oxidoreductase subunit C
MTDSVTPAPSADPEVPAAAPAAGRPDGEVIAVREGMFGVAGTGDTSGYGGLRTPVVGPAPSARPLGGYFDAVADALAAALPDPAAAVTSIVIDRDQMILHVDRDHLIEVATALRNDPALRFELCLGVSGVHYLDDVGRELHAVYPFLSITHNRRVLVEVTAPDDDPRIPSLVSLYPTCDWHERETFDFFGIVFEGHPHLTRIEMPDDWIGHPQRKDYPLGGIPVEYKGAEIPPPDQRRTYH